MTERRQFEGCLRRNRSTVDQPLPGGRRSRKPRADCRGVTTPLEVFAALSEIDPVGRGFADED